jgi:hypothetical protein
VLPGTVVVLMEELADGPLKKFTSQLPNQFSVWPARIVSYSPSFTSELNIISQENIRKENPKTKDMDNIFDQKIPLRHLIKFSHYQELSKFPEINIQGITPSRIFIFLLSVFFMILSFALAFSFIIKMKLGKNKLQTHSKKIFIKKE